MEEANKTAEKILGIRKKDWMIPWKQCRFMSKKKQSLDDQVILKSKIPRLQHLEYGSVNRSDHVLTTPIFGHIKEIGSHSATASRLDEGLQPKVAQGSEDSSVTVRSSIVDLTEPGPDGELSLNQLESSSDSNSVETPLTDQQQTDVDSIKTVSTQTPRSKNSRMTAKVAVPQQPISQLIFSTQLSVQESDPSLLNFATSIVATKTIGAYPSHKDLIDTDRQPCNSIALIPSTTTTDLIVRSSESLPLLTMESNDQNEKQLGLSREPSNNSTRHDSDALNRPAKEASQPVVQKHIPNTTENPDGPASAVHSHHEANVHFSNATPYPGPVSTTGLPVSTWPTTELSMLSNTIQPLSSTPPVKRNGLDYGALARGQQLRLSRLTAQSPHQQSFPEFTTPVNLDVMQPIMRMNQTPSVYPTMTQGGSLSQETLPGSPLNTNYNMAVLGNQQSMNFGPSTHGQAGQPSPIFNGNVPMAPRPFQEHPDIVRASHLFYRRHLTLYYNMPPAGLQFEQSIEIPSLQQFIHATGPEAEMIWKLVLARLQFRPNDLNMGLNQFFSGPTRLRLPYDLQTVCHHRDGKYLLMLQTFAILKMPIAMGLMCDARLIPGLKRLEELFGNVEEKSILWFVNLPCTYPSTQDGLQRWLQALSNDIRSIAVYMENFNNACFSKKRLPLMSEIDIEFWASIGIQTAVFRSLLVRWFPPPRDDCFFKILLCFTAGLREKQEIMLAFPANERLHKIDRIRKIVDAEIKACCKVHKKHRMPNPGTMTTNSNALVLPGNVFQPPREQNPVSVSTFVPSPSYSPSMTHSPTTRTVQRIMPPQQICLDPRNPYMPQLHQSLAFPTTSGPLRASEYGMPLHHAHLRDAITVQTAVNDENEVYRAYVDDFNAAESLKFTGEATILGKHFRVLEETFKLLAREKIDGSGGPPTRAINATSQLVRLRGAPINPKTTSEWYVAETSWPWSMAVLINNKAIEFRRKPQYTKDLAVDVTSLINQGRNNLLVSFLQSGPSPVDYHYTVVLERVKFVNIKDLSAKIQASKSNSTEEQLKSYFQKSADDEFEMIVEHLDISILDPFTSRMPDIPARSIHCKHFQCFDLDVFLKSRPKDLNKPDEFVCPICGKDARPGFLQFDGWMGQVLEKLKGDNRIDAKLIRVLPDLTWVVKEEGQAEKKSEPINVLPAASDNTSKVMEIIELD